MATRIEKRQHGDGSVDVLIDGSAAGQLDLLSRDTALADEIVRMCRVAYRAGRADEGAMRAAAMAGLMTGSPLS